MRRKEFTALKFSSYCPLVLLVTVSWENVKPWYGKNLEWWEVDGWKFTVGEETKYLD
jgi:hypothetical protein